MPRFRFDLLLLLLVLFCPLVLVSTSIIHAIEKPFDANALAKFARKIAPADRIIVSHGRSPVTLTITGQDVKQVIVAVSSAKPDRNTYACVYDTKAQFFNGTNFLSDVIGCSTILWINGRQYKEDTGIWDKLVHTPITKAVMESWEKRPDIN